MFLLKLNFSGTLILVTLYLLVCQLVESALYDEDTDDVADGRCRGYTCEDWERRQRKLIKYKALSKPNNNSVLEDEVRGTDGEHPETLTGPALQLANEELEDGDDFMVSEEQLDVLIADEEEKHKNQGGDNREKRKLNVGVSQSTTLKWDMPVHYKYDSALGPSYTKVIEAAIHTWEEHTCIKFKKLYQCKKTNDTCLVIVGKYYGCWSFVGRQKKLKKQLLNLSRDCLATTGTSMHEVGHALGLWHEHQRSDRDEYIDINYDNMGKISHAFVKMKTDNTVPYDYGSVMHYSQYGGSSNFQALTLPKDRLYTLMMGQRIQLSFGDHQVINMAYDCLEKNCKNKPLSQPCERAGYQDPNNCDICKCRDGFTGPFCEKLAPPKLGKCGGNITLSEPTSIFTPDFFRKKPYPNHMECTWYFKTATPDQNIEMYFSKKRFSIYKTTNFMVCHQWLEIRYKGKLHNTGPRFCGRIAPKAKLISEHDEVMILFRSPGFIKYPAQRTGFELQIRPVKNENYVPTSAASKTDSTSSIASVQKTTPKPTPSVTTSQSVTTTTQKPTITTQKPTITTQKPTITTQKPTTTTQKPTTTTKKPTTMTTKKTTTMTTKNPTSVKTQKPSTRVPTTSAGRTTTRKTAKLKNGPKNTNYKFKCDFEKKNICGLTQSTDHTFDWVVHKDHTPSTDTGPDKAHKGLYYVYFEASNRVKGDTARISTPVMTNPGKYCLSFWYYMFGFHVKQLRIYKQHHESQVEIWQKTKQQGQKWLHGQVQVDLDIGDTIMFEGIRGNGFSGDIALDDIELKSC